MQFLEHIYIFMCVYIHYIIHALKYNKLKIYLYIYIMFLKIYYLLLRERENAVGRCRGREKLSRLHMEHVAQHRV